MGKISELRRCNILPSYLCLAQPSPKIPFPSSQGCRGTLTYRSLTTRRIWDLSKLQSPTCRNACNAPCPCPPPVAVLEDSLGEYDHSTSYQPNETSVTRSYLFFTSANLHVKSTTDNAGFATPAIMKAIRFEWAHAVVTLPFFTVAMCGHSGAAGYGNHLQQSDALQVHRKRVLHNVRL
jgi:hypothetical protein